MDRAPRPENVVDITGRRTGASPAARAALAQVAEITQSRLVAMLAEALGQVDDTLFDFLQGGAAGGHGRHQQYFDAMRELRLKREQVLGAYGEHFRAGFRALEAGEPRSAERLGDAPAREGELRLVAEDDLEEQLAIDMLAQTLQRRLGRSLQTLDQRVAAAAGLASLDPAQNPAGAAYVAAGLGVALRGLEIGIAVKLVLFKLYERALGGRIDALCLDLNQRLAEAGVLPTVPDPAAPARPRTGASRAIDADGRDVREVVADARAALQAAGVSGAAGEGARGAEAQDDLLYETLSELLQAYREQRVAAPGAGAPAVAPGLPAQAAGGGSGARPLSSREMLSILSLLQAHPPLNVQAAIEDPEQSVTGLLKNELLKNAERLGLNPGETRVDPTDEDAIDLVGMLFDVLLDERDLPTGARPLLGRLLVPYVKVALLDRRMFLRKTHPARRLLNSLSEALAGGEPERDRELLDQVEHAVDRLTHEFNEDIAIFEAVEQDFNEFVERYRRRVALAEKRAAEAQQGRERLDRARARAMADLDATLAGREPSPAVRMLLNNAWLHHLTMVILRGGIGATAYRDALALGEQVLTLTANWPADEQARVQAREVLQAAIDTMLSTAGGDPGAAAAQADAIAAELSGAEGSTARVVEALAVPMPRMEQASPTEEEPVEVGTHLPEEMERLRALKVGTWIELRDADGEMKPAKLSWISPISSKRLFVNRRGLRICVASLEELAAKLHAGELVIREGDTAFEQAMHQVLGRLGAAVNRNGAPVA
ncbi:DUF1631 family protein [Coralloluteibacterium thermophilus]|uniref:DUF1631 family protein n=1 Tax=Coralloluteibacterium thermophilum TaxID=2707049 RepID=A0ABV9NK09_9GAMM